MKNLHSSNGTRPFSLSLDSFSHIRETLFNSPNPATLSKLTEQELSTLALRCQAHWSQTSRLLNSAWLWVALACLPALLATAMTASYLSPSLSPAGWAAFLMVTYLVCGMGSSAVVFVGYQLCAKSFGWEAAEYLVAQLKPLGQAESARAHSALLVFPGLRACDYRNSLVQSGRTLRTVDLAVLQVLLMQDRNSTRKAELLQSFERESQLEMA